MAWRQELARLILVLFLCLATALAVSATAYLCAWLSLRKDYTWTEEHAKTREDLERLRTAIEAYKKTTGAYPDKLSDLRIVKQKLVRVEKDGEPVDAWNYPVQYRIQADNFLLISFGPEHLPGGIGKHADMVAGQPDAWPEHPTLFQFSDLPEARSVQAACILAGAAAFPLCLLVARKEKGQRVTIGRILTRSAAIGVFAIVAALLMSALHRMPGGH